MYKGFTTLSLAECIQQFLLLKIPGKNLFVASYYQVAASAALSRVAGLKKVDNKSTIRWREKKTSKQQLLFAHEEEEEDVLRSVFLLEHV